MKLGRLGWTLVALGGAAAVGGAVYLASGGSAKASTLPPGGAIKNATGTTYTLDATNAGPIPLTLNAGALFTLTTPPGGTITTISWPGGPPNSSGTTDEAVVYTPTTKGTTTLSVSWNDGGGTPHSTILNITVQ